MSRSFTYNDNALARLIEDWVRTQPIPKVTTFVKQLAPKVHELRGRKVDLNHLERELRKWRVTGSMPIEFRGPVAAVLGVDPDIVDDACGDNDLSPLATPPLLRRLRYVAAPLRLWRDSTTEVVAADMSLVLHNPNDFDLRFSATIAGEMNGVHGDERTLSVEGFVDANSDLTLDYDRIWDIPVTRTNGVSDACLAGELEYEVTYQSAFTSSIQAKKGARLRLIVWKWPFEDGQNKDCDVIVRFGNEIEEILAQ